MLLAWSLIIVWGAVFCVFLEGKSSYDLAFTLWDDQYAKVPLEPMGRVILPQFAVYAVFLVITGMVVAMFVNSRFFKQFAVMIILATAVLLLSFVIAFGTVTEEFVGGRQGPTGWTILEYPWLSLLLFCMGNASGMIGIWFLISQEIPRITTSFETRQVIKEWTQVISMWRARILIIIVFVLGSIALNAGSILTFKHINAAFVIAAIGCVAAMFIIFFKSDVLQSDFKKQKQTGKKQIWLFTPDPIIHRDGTKFNRVFDFVVNPRNIAWRAVRNVFNGILTAVGMFLITAMCFMTVPDEWVFERFFDLLPWMLIGVLIGIGFMSIFPEPAIYYSAIILFVIQTYDSFLVDFSIPFDPTFIAINGGLFGFWIAVFFSSQFYIFRSKTRGRNFNLMIFLMITFSLTWMILCFVGRFQHAGQMVQDPITAVLDVLFPIFLTISEYFLYISIGFWGLDIVYRVYRKFKPVMMTRQVKPESLQGSAAPKQMMHMPSLQINISNHRKKLIALLVIGIFAGSFSIVQVTHVYGNEIRPLLYRSDEFGIWTVDAVTKVEKDFAIQMPSFAPIESTIDVAAARGEWNGFHVLISPQPGKTSILTNVSWDAFVPESGGATINASIMEVYLVSYLVDRQPDPLVELPSNVTRTGGEHADLYFRLLVPRNATAGVYDDTIHLTVNSNNCPVLLHLQVYNFTIPANNHLRTSFGGYTATSQWYDEMEYLRISQYDMGIPFRDGFEYSWNNGTKQFDFNWAVYDAAFQAQLNRNFTSFTQGYFPNRPPPTDVANDSQWAIIEAQFLHNVSEHLESKKWTDQAGTNHSWVEIPFMFGIDEPSVSQYPTIRDAFDRYHANGTSKLRTLLTEQYDPTYPILDTCVDTWCPVIGNFEPSAVTNRHAKGQEYWFYVCVGPVAPYPDMLLWEQGNDQRLLPYICARFNADGFLYWHMTFGNWSYRAGFDGNGDGQLAFPDPLTGRLLPGLRLLSFSLGIQDFECIWLMRATKNNPGKTGVIPDTLLSRIDAMETRLNNNVGARPQFINHDAGVWRDFKADLSRLLMDLWPYSKNLYS